MRYIDSLPWLVVVILCLSLGLAPFTPEPHVWEKLKLLQAGALSSAIDSLDLLIHAAPWLILSLKIGRFFKVRS